MNIKKIIELSHLTNEQKKEHLAKTKSELKKRPGKSDDFVGLSSKANPAVNLKKGDGFAIEIPNIYTAFNYPGIAATLKNLSDGEIYYGYTYDGSQKGYYKYTIAPNKSTGNGQGSDSFTHHCLIIEIPIRDGSGESGFFVPVVKEFEEIYDDTLTPFVAVFATRSKSDNPPLFQEKVGNPVDDLLSPTQFALDDGYNYHVTISCYNDRVHWSSDIG